MFGMLKKKFKGLTDKVFGKSEEKAKEVSEEKEVFEKEPVIEVVEEKPIEKVKVPSKETVEEKVEDKPVESKIESKIESEEKLVVKQSETKENLIKDTINVGQKDVSFENLKEDIESDIKLDFSENKEVTKKISEVIDEPKKEPEKEIAPSGHSFTKKELEEGYERKIDSSSKEYEELSSKKKEDIKKGVSTSIKSLFSSKIKLSETDINSFLEDFEFSLLEADVSIDASQAIVSSLKEKLKNSSFSKKNLMDDIKEVIKKSLLSELGIDCDIEKYLPKDKKPLIILFIGPNGAGKTTTIAKFAKRYKDEGKKIVLSSSDTFRAGSIDQLQEHANRIGVKIIKQNYGSDPAAVAFDAVTSAKANDFDVVLIDTAGRQDTNSNLLKELEKIKRVVKPNLTIYIGESQTGQTIVEQISKFDKDIGLDGVILTKIDTDPKGGVAISILNELKKPIFYIGTGQNYEDLEKFSPSYIINRIV